MVKKEIIVYGMKSYLSVIEILIDDLNLEEDYFDVKLILTEALTNAYKHGNNSDNSKPIRVLCFYTGQSIYFEIEDTHTQKDAISIPDEIDDESLLNESGKGLFLLKALSDEVGLKNNTLYIKKQLLYT